MMPPWRIRIEGRENVRKNAASVVVSNHQSQLDILVAFRLFFHYKWVSKIEMFRIPVDRLEYGIKPLCQIETRR